MMYQVARTNREPAMIAVPLQAPAAMTGAVLCAVSLLGSARPMLLKLPDMPELPKMPSVPKLPKLNLPNISLPGQGKTEAQAKKVVSKATETTKAVAAGAARVVPKVRVGAVKAPIGSDDAPTLAEIRGQQGGAVRSLSQGGGWKQFPQKRVAGASMDGFRQIARDIAPKF
jgi:hypothetical protein